MAKLNDTQIRDAFAAHLDPRETLRHWAFGVKQPSILLMVPLILLGVIPGVIAVLILTRNYLIGLTDRRLIVLRVKSISDAELQEVHEYAMGDLRNDAVKTSTGPLFTHIRIDGPSRPFVAKFHRAFSRDNRAHAMAIADAISDPA